VNDERYYDALTSIATLEAGDRVLLRREPQNPHDRRAIEVLDARGRKLGYVARIDNSAIARMMDAGERFEARVGRIDRNACDIRLEIDWLRA
ncbi:MAG TPA: HIRAN domain-containing protein, partial [Sphingomonas sp.]|nr:HIRAN domain-containing protein [Sphingomonas sp.]